MQGIEGDWVGHITGTNSGPVNIRIFANGDTLDGYIDLTDREFGRTRFLFDGFIQADQFSLTIIPKESQDNVIVSPGTVSGRLLPNGTLAGIWDTELGTSGEFTVQRGATSMNNLPINDKVPKDKIRRLLVTPLGVISLFLSLCEIFATIAVSQAEGGVQVALVVFVISFPVLIGSAFFAVLWNKAYVFYPPSEYGTDTNISDFVQALAVTSPTQAAKSQNKLIDVTAEHEDKRYPVPSELDTEEAKGDNDAAFIIFKFFAIKKMRYTDVSGADALAVFNLGRDQGFNLFDGVPGIIFFGYFNTFEPVEIVAHTRFLLTNIDLSYRRVREREDPVQRDAGIRILDQIQIEVLIPEDAHLDNIIAKIKEFCPEGLTTPVAAYKMSKVENVIQQQYEDMTPSHS